MRALRFAAALAASLPIVAMAGEVDAGPEEGAAAPQAPEDKGVYLFLDGNLKGALVAEDACSDQVPRCRSLAWEMREFSKVAKLAPALTSEEWEKLSALDRNISPNARSRLLTKVGRSVAAAQCPVARYALQKGEFKEACRHVQFARRAHPDNACVESVRLALRKAWTDRMNDVRRNERPMSEALDIYCPDQEPEISPDAWPKLFNVNTPSERERVP